MIIDTTNHYWEASLLKKFIMLFWTMLLLVSLIPAYASSQPSDLTKGYTVQSVSMRVEAKSSSSFIRYLKKTEIFSINAKINPYWYQIRDVYGNVGYVTTNKTYVRAYANAEVIAQVNFRILPNVNSSSIRKLYPGESLLVLEKINENWYKVQDQTFNQGYVSANEKYLATDFSIEKIVRPRNEQIELMLSHAFRYMGTPYVLGSDRLETSTFDCSDFIQQSFWDSSPIYLPSDSRAQGNRVLSLGNYSTDWRQLNRGDLVFFMAYRGYRSTDYTSVNPFTETITHAGIYLGDGKMINTRSVDSGGVRLDDLTEGAWTYRFLYGGSAW